MSSPSHSRCRSRCCRSNNEQPITQQKLLAGRRHSECAGKLEQHHLSWHMRTSMPKLRS